MIPRRVLMLGTTVCGVLLLAGCAAPGSGNGGTGVVGNPAGSVATPIPPNVTITPADRAIDVALDAPVAVNSFNGTITAVSLIGPGGVTVAGTLAGDGRSWSATDGLDPGVSYAVSATVVGAQGTHTTAASTFITMHDVAGRLRTTVSPDDGVTAGVAKTIDLRFNTAIPQEQQAALARRLVVTSVPAQNGAWHWFTPSEIHYRPENYWLSGTKVTLNANLHGVNAGHGYWGLASFSQGFTVGDKHVSLIDNTTHTMQVFSNDKLLYTWPVSLGKPGFATLEGTLQVLAKAQKVTMDSCGTFGGAACVPGSANYYHEDVFWDTAVSTNGFFIHAAPWSQAQQGVRDVSHGCVNLSTTHAATFFDFARIGDAVVISHTGNIADLSNGEADWQIPFAQFDNTGNPAPTQAAPIAPSGGL